MKKAILPAKKQATKQTKKQSKILTNIDYFDSTWLADVSLEAPRVPQAYGKGERSFELLMSAQRATTATSGTDGIIMRLRGHITIEGATVALAEIHYAGAVKSAHQTVAIQELQAELYPYARESLSKVLALANQYPPLPAQFSDIIQK